MYQYLDTVDHIILSGLDDGNTQCYNMTVVLLARHPTTYIYREGEGSGTTALEMEMEVPAEPSPRHEKAVRAAGARRSALGSGLYDTIINTIIIILYPVLYSSSRFVL
jgi:hypothetical protein